MPCFGLKLSSQNCNVTEIFCVKVWRHHFRINLKIYISVTLAQLFDKYCCYSIPTECHTAVFKRTVSVYQNKYKKII
jgi:hypothetical protein